MDASAELTLRILRTVQEHRGAVASEANWTFVPDGRRVPWAEARELLAAMPKPVIVAPLTEPGYLSVWVLDRLSDQERTMGVKSMANQKEYYLSKLETCALGDAGVIELVVPTGRLTLSVPEFDRWSKEYVLSVGVTLNATATPGLARILIRPPGGSAAPIGWEPTLPQHSCGI